MNNYPNDGTCKTECSSPEGVTVGLIDFLIVICRVLVNDRKLLSKNPTKAVMEALNDLRSCDPVRLVTTGLPFDQFTLLDRAMLTSYRETLGKNVALEAQVTAMREALTALREEVSAGTCPDSHVEMLKNGIHHDAVVLADRALAALRPTPEPQRNPLI